MSIRPLFVFSLPRSGSTLVQRLLASHPAISTASEPWLLLPFLYALRARGTYAEYGHGLQSLAMEDFLQELPHGIEDYKAALHDFALRLYGQAADGSARYFLDKTPRYHLIAEEIMSLFPEGKFIFLWRNPLAVVASMMQSWAEGKWNLYKYKIDLFKGFSRLMIAYQNQRTKCFALRYEDLVTSPQACCAQVFEYLELEFSPALLSQFAGIELRGRLGDPVGTKEYDRLSSEPLHKWKAILANPLRRLWCRRYLQWVGRERLATMGYDLEKLTADLKALPLGLRFFASDCFRALFGLSYPLCEPRIFWHKLERVRARRRLYAHG